MPRKKQNKEQSSLFNVQEYLSTAPCVPAIRNAVASWKENGYKNITDTSRELLNYWFESDHILPNGLRFKYHQAQQEAIESLIFIYEVEKIRSRKELLEKFAVQTPDLRLSPYDDFSRFCIKMATGTGKTKVMSLAIAWQYFNAVKESESGFAKNFLIIAPNVIVFERLKTDFAGGTIFRLDPLFPKHYEIFWDFEFYMRGDPERTSSEGALYLTNIQQFYERMSTSKSDEPEEITAVLGGKPKSKKVELTDFDERISKRDGQLMVLNDEAHHTHDEDNEWNKFIRTLHTQKSICGQMDFSATPRYSKGALFAWTIFDYPLKQAIVDGIVKRPIKGISKVTEAKSDIASVRYAAFLTAAVERWKEYFGQLKPLEKKPILFVMMNNTDDADDVGDWLRRKYPEHFSDKKTLVIHTDKSGEVSKKDLEDARRVSREVDSGESPVNVIVSVLMLREGWDVQNVTVVVGLRPYTSKANILPEQTIGRGLRLMFRGSIEAYKERVDIIGNKPFLEFVDDLEKLEGLKLETFEIGKDKLQIVTIMPDGNKKDFDIGIPEITPFIVRKKSLSQEIWSIDVMQFKVNPLPLKEKDIEDTKTFIYEGYDILTKQKELEREYKIPPAQTPEEVIGYYARRIANNIKLPSQFAALAPKIRDFFENKAFGKTVNLNETSVIRAMSSNIASYVVIKEFEKALRNVIVEDKKPELVTLNRFLSSTPPFPFSKNVHEASKTIFNYVACHNEFEISFAKFLQSTSDVKAFAKLPEQFGFSINYTDSIVNMRYYYPDFVAKLNNESYWLIETKGREDIDVLHKDRAAKLWCEYATELSGANWKYIKVGQKEFEKLHPDSFQELENTLITN